MIKSKPIGKEIIKIDVKLEMIHKNIKPEIEIIRNICVETTKSNVVILKNVINQLIIRGYRFENTEIWYYSKPYMEYVFCEKYPISDNIYVEPANWSESPLLIKIEYDEREGIIPTTVQAVVPGKRKKYETNDPGKVGGIEQLIYIELWWRELFRGFPDHEGNISKFQLLDAAKIMGYKKKTLDDNLQLIKFGKMHGFDFNKDGDSSISCLRGFKKEFKKFKENNECIG